MICWQVAPEAIAKPDELTYYLNATQRAQLDYIEQVQLNSVIETCLESQSAAEASRKLYNVSRTLKKSTNDSHRLGVYLKKYNLSFEEIKNTRMAKSR